MQTRLKQFRKALGYDQMQMGSVLNVKQSTYCFIETGRRKLMDRHIQLMVERCYLNTEWLLTGEGSMFLETVEEKRFMDLFYSLKTNDRQFLIMLMEFMVTRGRNHE